MNMKHSLQGVQQYRMLWRCAAETKMEIETICQKDQDMRRWSETVFRQNFSICASHLFK